MQMKYQENAMTDEEIIAWFNENGHWLIRKVPNTKGENMVAGEVQPPDHVKEAYGIKKS
jgi:hypothetical protein